MNIMPQKYFRNHFTPAGRPNNLFLSPINQTANEKLLLWGAWVAQLVKHLTSAQVVISGFWD